LSLNWGRKRSCKDCLLISPDGLCSYGVKLDSEKTKAGFHNIPLEPCFKAITEKEHRIIIQTMDEVFKANLDIHRAIKS
jgi:hypothetical protein